MTNTAKPNCLAPNTGAALSVLGDVYRVLTGGADTGGAYAMLEARIQPGGGPPPPVHAREDEAFFVRKGELAFPLGDHRGVAGAGAFVQGPRGIPHAFKNESQRPARLLVFVTPAGFEKFIAEIAMPLASFDSPPVPATAADFQKLLAVALRYGIEILPPPQ
jgi:mannose-6-phosphate isomerase-like protein (cupin superfamily)